MKNTEQIEVNGVKYIRADTATQPRLASVKGKPYVLVRSAQSGCHAGYLKSEDGPNITLINARRLWYWDGAATLSQLAMEGVKAPDKCKFPCEVAEITVYNCCEKLPATEAAKASIAEVPVWKR